MSHLEDTTLQLEGAVGHAHDLEPVTVVYLPGVELLEQGQDGLVLTYLSTQLPGCIPLLLLHWETPVGLPEPFHLGTCIAIELD